MPCDVPCAMSCNQCAVCWELRIPIGPSQAQHHREKVERRKTYRVTCRAQCAVSPLETLKHNTTVKRQNIVKHTVSPSAASQRAACWERCLPIGNSQSQHHRQKATPSETCRVTCRARRAAIDALPAGKAVSPLQTLEHNTTVKKQNIVQGAECRAAREVLRSMRCLW